MRLQTILAIGILMALCLPAETNGAEPVNITIRAISLDNQQCIPCKIRLEKLDGTPILPEGEYDYRKWFPIRGEKEITIEPGRYILRASRGIESIPTRREVEITQDGQTLTASIGRWINMNERGWWSGDTHIHRPLHIIADLILAEDLNIAPVLTYWNDTSMYKDGETPSAPTYAADPHHIYSVMNEEHEKRDGAVMIFNLESFLKVAGYGPHAPDALALIQETHKQGAWVEIEKPFWPDTPLWLALGNAHSTGIVHNHFYELDTMNNEAWGRKRDPWYSKKPVGLAHYVMDLYYKALNCGYRLAAVGGSASGVLDNPIGQNRTYVYLGRYILLRRLVQSLERRKKFRRQRPNAICQSERKTPRRFVQTRNRSPAGHHSDQHEWNHEDRMDRRWTDSRLLSNRSTPPRSAHPRPNRFRRRPLAGGAGIWRIER